MKKILLSLGAVAAVVTPVVTVLSCGTADSSVVDVNKGTKSFASSNSATTAELQKGLESAIVSYAPLSQGDVSNVNPVGPNSNAAYNYSGAIGILNAVYSNILSSPKTVSGDADKVMNSVKALLHELLMNKEILTNNSTQNLNIQATADKLYNVLKGLGMDKLKTAVAKTELTGFTFKAGTNKGKTVEFAISGGTVTLTAKA